MGYCKFGVIHCAEAKTGTYPNLATGGEEPTMNFSGRNLWFGLVALAVVLIGIGYATGWFGGTP